MEQWITELGLSPQLFDLALTWVGRILGALLVLFASFIVAGWVSRLLVSRLEKISFDVTLTKFLGSLSRWAIIIFAILGCLGIFGIETTSFAAVIGGASLAIGLAFQGSLSNVAAGAMLLLFRPYNVGDVITVSGQTGTVDAIDLFMTTLDTSDNRRIMVPNGQVFGNTIENVTYHDKRRVDIKVAVSYDADIDRTRAVLKAAGESIAARLTDTDIAVVLTALGTSSVDWRLSVWAATGDYGRALEQGTQAVKLALDAAGISIPYPHQVVINKAD